MIEYRSISKTFADGTEAVADFSLELPSRTTTVLVAFVVSLEDGVADYVSSYLSPRTA